MASSKEDNVEKISVKNYRSISDSGNIDICPLTVVVEKIARERVHLFVYFHY